jgi:hypothetical protein
LADAWRAVSEGIRQRVFRYSGGLQPPPVLTTGVELPTVTTVPPSLRSPREPLRLLYAAWLDERVKRVMDLPVLADELFVRGVDFRLTIAGKGPAARRLAGALAMHIVAGRVVMAGPVEYARMPALHRDHDLTVLVSAMEGSPVVVMEAMAHGRGVAITRGCGGALRAVRDGESGIVVSVGDMPALAARLAELAAQPERIADMGRCARMAAESHFDMNRVAADFDQLVRDSIHASEVPMPTCPDDTADLWNRILAALEYLGPSSTSDLCSLACEWLSDLGVQNVHLHLTEDAAHLVDALTRSGPELIRGLVRTSPGDAGQWGGWPIINSLRLPEDALILSTQPSVARAALPCRTHVLPLVLPGLPTLAARLLLGARDDLRAGGHERVALYGAGKHTRKLGRWIAEIPEIVAIVDDQAGETGGPGERLLGIPIIKPACIEELDVDAVIVSSDEHERAMLHRARTWAGQRPVVPLYQALETAAGSVSTP